MPTIDGEYRYIDPIDYNEYDDYGNRQSTDWWGLFYLLIVAPLLGCLGCAIIAIITE